MGVVNWFGLSKTATDPQTIDEGMDVKIGDHNNDPDAHMLVGETLDLHRNNSVIDHPAESVVNDKIEVSARSYVAIVDPLSDENFDTIEGAIAYAITAGGGSIYVVAGTHYLSTAVKLPLNIYLVGDSALTTIISCGYTSGEYFSIDKTIVDPLGIWGFENIVFDNLAGGAIYDTTYTGNSGNTLRFINCLNLNNQLLVGRSKEKLRFVDCVFSVGTVTLISSQYGCDVINCLFMSGNPAALNKIFTNSVGAGLSAIYDIQDSEFYLSEELVNDIFDSMPVAFSKIINNTFEFANFNTVSFGATKILYNKMTFGESDYLGVLRDNNIIIGNNLEGSTEKNIQLASTADKNIIMGNDLDTVLTVAGTDNVIANNTLPQYFTTTTTATVVDLENNEVVYQAPSASKTLTTPIPPAGTQRVLILFQSNTTAKTITFGTGFKTTGTLALGTVANRRFTLIFVSDGTSLIQIARSTAIA